MALKGPDSTRSAASHRPHRGAGVDVLSEGNPRFLAPRAAYVHVPFCRHRCGYCNFTLVAGRDDLIGAYLEALARELSWLSPPQAVDTLYIGGGTPTHLDGDQLARLLELVCRCFPLVGDYEFSVEANPIDVTAEKIDLLRSVGVNRISLGVQSFDAAKLAALERDHRRGHIERAFALSRRSIETVSLDLIFAVPGETRATWQADLDAALRLAPDHVSSYGLTYERGTRFWARRARGEFAQADETLERQMFEAAIDTLAAAGLEHYEISSFARPGSRCRHNEAYWTGRTYFGAGPGAARHLQGRREMNHRSTTTWLRRVLAERSPVAESETLSAEDAARERLVFSLRRLEGVDRASFARETGYQIETLGGDTFAKLIENGLLHDTGAAIRLTRPGILLCDSICAALLNASVRGS